MDPAVAAAAIGVSGTVIVGLAGYWASVRNTSKTIELAHSTVELTKEGQVADRYTRAIEQLGSDKLDVRIGGIYALERIAYNSEPDHPTVMEVLATFVRDHSPEQWPLQIAYEAGVKPPKRKTRPDIQAAATVIGRRTIEYDRRTTRHGRQPINLNFAHLEGAALVGAHFERAHLLGAHLDRANFSSAHLDDAHLSGAHLDGAVFDGADLTGAFWPSDAEVPEGWQRDTDSGCLKRADANAGNPPTDPPPGV